MYNNINPFKVYSSMIFGKLSSSDKSMSVLEYFLISEDDVALKSDRSENQRSFPISLALEA